MKENMLNSVKEKLIRKLLIKFVDKQGQYRDLQTVWFQQGGATSHTSFCFFTLVSENIFGQINIVQTTKSKASAFTRSKSFGLFSNRILKRWGIQAQTTIIHLAAIM